MKKTVFLVVLLLFATTASAQSSERYRVLVPVYYAQPVPGAFGSLWKTEYAVHNPTSTTFVLETCSHEVCLAVLTDEMEVRPNETDTRLPDLQSVTITPRPEARQLFIRSAPNSGSATPDRLAFQLRAADVSRSHLNAGMEVPVVRQSDFRTATTNLLNIPVDPVHYRLTFRLYELNQLAADFMVRVYDAESGALVISAPVHVQTVPQGRYLFQPASFQSSVESLGGTRTPLPSRIRVEIEPLTQGSAFWAFVSITNNETQMLTLVTPQ